MTQFKLADAKVLPDSLEIKRNGKISKLEPRLIEVLLFLVEHAGAVVSRDELITKVWRGAVVSDNAINRSITQLRKALGDDARAPTLIETIPKKGYRLIAPVVWLESAPETASINQASQPRKKSNGLAPRPLWLSVGALILLVALYLGFNFAPENLSPRPTQITQVTSLSGVESYPAFSPDSRSIVFSYHQADDTVWDLAVKSLDSDQVTPLELSSGLNISPAWSFQNNSIAFVRWNNLNQRRCSIHLLHLNPPAKADSRVEKLLNCGERSSPNISWHPTEYAFYFTDRATVNRPYAVYRYDVRTGNKQQVSLPPQGELGHFATAISPDGSGLAVLSYIDEATTRLSFLNTATGEPINQQTIKQSLQQVSWLSNHTLLARGAKGLLKIGTDGELEALNLPFGERYSQTSVSPDGRQVALVETWREHNIWRADLDLTETKTVTGKPNTNDPQNRQLWVSSSRLDFSPKYTNHSNDFVFYSDRSGKRQLWLYQHSEESGEGTTTQLTDLAEGLSFSPLSWSPDDRLILFKHNKQLLAIDLTTQKSHIVIDAHHGAYNYTWTADGKAIIFASKKSGDWQLWRAELNHLETTEKVVQITQNGGYGPRVSADNQSIYFTKFHQAGLWHLNLDSQQESLITPEFSILNWLNWQLSPMGAYYLAVETADPGIYFYDFASKQSRRILDKHLSQSNDFSVSADGKHILYSQTDGVNGDIHLLKLVPGEE